jgi:CMP-N-acetylneuraminic acid synthetase
MNNSIVGLIPVKGSSERVKQKNLRPFADTNLYELKLNQLSKTKNFSEIIVSSENHDILEVAKKYGFNIHQRNPKYSTSDIPMSDVYTYIASEINGENIAWINVTNPLAEAEIYDTAITKYNQISNQYDCLLSAYELKENIFYNGKPINFKPYPWPKSQDLKGTHALSFVINILKRKDMVNWGSCVGNKPFLHELDTITSWDIDFQEDFDFCESVYKKNNNLL